ncbi:hypothetical protein ElyMa_007023900 [Elysia marginata]|uniref:Uncharacterized protein n=1 Tax=Elysia marginata TaxID=1093978 RepID=A0AAV4JRB1_9GAST|nr:hypothetical protein ElyMa_007023900 [Elysia marginata]
MGITLIQAMESTAQRITTQEPMEAMTPQWITTQEPMGAMTPQRNTTQEPMEAMTPQRNTTQEPMEVMTPQRITTPEATQTATQQAALRVVAQRPLVVALQQFSQSADSWKFTEVMIGKVRKVWN